MESVPILLVAAALAAPLFLFHYLRRLPEAPACPACRSVTCEAVVRGAPSVMDRAWALLHATPVRSCTTCGWEGRMRWRWATRETGEGEG